MTKQHNYIQYVYSTFNDVNRLFVPRLPISNTVLFFSIMMTSVTNVFLSRTGTVQISGIRQRFLESHIEYSTLYFISEPAWHSYFICTSYSLYSKTNCQQMCQLFILQVRLHFSPIIKNRKNVIILYEISVRRKTNLECNVTWPSDNVLGIQPIRNRSDRCVIVT